MTITELSIKRPTLIVVIFAILGVLGIFSYEQLKYELLPKMNIPWVTIITAYPGASPQEVETSVTKQLEDAVSGIDKVNTVYGTSQEGVSIVSMEFKMTADVNVALQDVQRKVNEVQATFPDAVKAPRISKFAFDELPVLRMGVTGNLPSTQFYQLVKDRIQPRLAKVEGVGQITLVGGDEREIKVNVDAQKLRSCGLSILQVSQAIKASNLDFPTGNVEQGENQYVIRVAGKFKSIEGLRDLVIGQSKQGGDIRVRDIAEVQDGQKDYTTISRINGKTSVGILVQKQSEANSVDVSSLVRQEIPKIEADYNYINLKFDIAQDGSSFTLDAANAVKEDLAIAVALVAIVMLAFLHSIRNSVIVMIAIPASMVSTFIAMYVFGLSLNLMTLLGLSLVVGILVDDSIVVLENIYRHLEKGDDRKIAALRGRNEIGFAALSITMVDVVVFVPLALVTGLIGNIMREFALVVVFSTLMSLFVSFTITPMLASRFGKHERLSRDSLLGRFAVWFEEQFRWLSANYASVLKWALVNRWNVIVTATALIFASLLLPAMGFIGAEFMTQTDRGEFTVTLELPPGSTLDNTNYVARKAEEIVSTMPEVKKMFVNVGSSSEGLIGQSSNNVAEINIALYPKNERKRSTDDVNLEIKRQIAQIPGVKVRSNPIGIFGTANQAPIQLVISGPTYEDAIRSAEHVADMVRTIPGAVDVRLSSEEGKPEMRVEIDRQKMAALGLTVADVGSTLRVALNGDDDSKFRDGSDEYTLRIQYDKFDRSNTADVGNISFINRKGQSVELKQFATIMQTNGPTKLQRENRNYAVTVFAQAIGRASGDIGDDIKAGLEKNPLPTGVHITYRGDLQNQAEGFSSLFLAFGAAILFVFLIMVALYDSWAYPFVVLFSIPVALIGALLALALTMKTLSIFSLLGFIMLAGLVGKNAILLVDRTNQMRLERGLSVRDALLEAAETRLRPILMTTMTMVFGMSPIAFSTSAGSEWKSGLAWALIGGLLSSLMLTLVLVPVMYVKVDQWRESVPSFFRRLVSAVKARKAKSVQPSVDPKPVPVLEYGDSR